ncbi:MAG: hypothetical protein GY849_04215 [Deltaproteobacteria bacterium]|nr:hypothetical protein [Deltaproteobacteria bacterium]
MRSSGAHRTSGSTDTLRAGDTSDLTDSGDLTDTTDGANTSTADASESFDLRGLLLLFNLSGSLGSLGHLRSLTLLLHLLLLSISLVATNTSTESLEVTHHTAVLRLFLNGISEETDRAILLRSAGTESIADESEVHGLEEGVRVNVGSFTALSASNILLGGRSVIIGNGVIIMIILFLLASIGHGFIDLVSNGDVLLRVVLFNSKFELTFNRGFSTDNHRLDFKRGLLNSHTVIEGGHANISGNRVDKKVSFLSIFN